MGTEQTKMPSGSTAFENENNQFLTFSLGSEEYGVDILKVQEIKGYLPTTRIPNSPPQMAGVLNLRGTIMPIIDLRRQFHMDDIAYDQFAAIIVVVLQDRLMGVIVDRVSEVMTIPTADIQPAPELGDAATMSVLRGLAKVGERMIILLDINALLQNVGTDLLAA
jgi:purine-binding chemotaxis protein CheW